MHFNIYLDDQTAEQLQNETDKSQLSRNAIIRQAIKNWLNRKKSTWPEEVLNYAGEHDFTSFESHRSELSKPTDDPFL